MRPFRTLLLITATLVPLQSAALGVPTFTLSTPEVECDGMRATVYLDWEDLSGSGPYIVQRKLSWRTGWQNVIEDLDGYYAEDSPTYTGRSTFLYRILHYDSPQVSATNTVRVDVSSCFAETPSLLPTQVEFEAPKKAPLLWGATVGYEAKDGDVFENQVGKTMTARTADVYWGNENEFPLDLSDAFEGKTMVLFWNLGDYTAIDAENPRFSYDSVIRGDWDDYIAAFAGDAKEYGKPVLLVPFPEMNVEWNMWSGTQNGNTAEKFVLAYRHVHDFFADVPNVQFGWAVANESVPDIGVNSIAGYYPGDTYVDVIGVTGYNYGDPWSSFHDVFAPALFTFQIFQKPIFIFGMGTLDGPGKAEWISDALTLQMQLYPEIIGWIWNNVPYDPAFNWKVDSTPESLKAFRDAVSHY